MDLGQSNYTDLFFCHPESANLVISRLMRQITEVLRTAEQDTCWLNNMSTVVAILYSPAVHVVSYSHASNTLYTSACKTEVHDYGHLHIPIITDSSPDHLLYLCPL